MRRRWLWVGLVAAALAGGACSDDTSSSGDGGSGASGGQGQGGQGGQGEAGGGGAGGATTMFGGDRPVELFVPDGYDAATPAPLMILLHGYSASGVLQESYFKLKEVANAEGILYAHPDGTVDGMSNQFWNATDACCNFYGTSVDDSAYLRQLVDDISAAYSVDPKRIYFIGHSNGGFMSYRMACDHADTVAAIVSLAGATYASPDDCQPAAPVHLLQIHGTADDTILFDGGDIIGNSYPGAVASAEFWAGHAGCDLQSPESDADIDLETMIADAETKVTRYTQGCSAGGSAELWSIEGGGHIPNLAPDFAQRVVDFMLAHPKP